MHDGLHSHVNWSVITDSVCDTQSVIIAIRKVVPQKYGVHPIDCASNINVLI